MHFPNYWLQKMWLLKCIKGPVLEHTLTVSVLTGPKHCWSPYGNTFILCFHQSKKNWFGKILCELVLKCYVYLLTHWLPMTSILLVISGIYRDQIKCNYLKNQKLFLEILLRFWSLRKIWNILEKNITVRSYVFHKLFIKEKVFTWMLKSPASEHPLAVNVLMYLKHCWNLHGTTFILSCHKSEINWVGKLLCQLDLKSYVSMLTYWLTIRSILVIIGKIYGKKFECIHPNYLNFFVEKLFCFRNLYKILKI